MRSALRALAPLLLTLGALAQQFPAAPPTPQVQPLPAAPSAPLTAAGEQQIYMPLSRQAKFERWVHHTYSPYLFLSTTVNAAWSQAMGDWPTYGGGMEGYGKRFGATLADTEARDFFKGFVFPSLLRQDPRYFRSGKSGFVPRAVHAASRVIVTRNDDGDHTFNTSQLLGTAVVRSLTNAYYPRRDRGFAETMSGVGSAYISDATSNVLREFWPDIRRLFRRHAPERVKKIEEKIPAPLMKMASPEPPSERQ